MFWWAISILLTLVGGSLLGNAFLVYPSMSVMYAFTNRLPALLIGALVLTFGLFLARRCASSPPSSQSKSFLSSIQEGFVVFAASSFVFNSLMVFLGKSRLDPTPDFLHFIPAMLMNAVWEGLISPSGGSIVLTASGIAFFDACFGCLVGLLLSPFQRVVPRAVWIIILVASFVAFEASLIRWMAFRL